MDSISENPLLTVVVPAYNEEQALPSFAPCLIELCRSRGWMTVFVNDGSCDHTGQILDHLSASQEVRVVHHKVNRGYGGALKTGISHVTTPFLCIRADCQSIVRHPNGTIAGSPQGGSAKTS